jgi:5-oxoprolinase (ATP-hydrolysing)
VLYVFRTLVGRDIPLNEGCLKPLRLILPERSMINPEYPAAVIAGNTEVSQAITECALRRARRHRGKPGDDEQLHLGQ